MESFQTLYSYELKKIYQRKTVWITIGILLGMTLYMAGAMSLMSTKTLESGEVLEGFARLYYEKELAKPLTGKNIDDTMLSEMKTAYANMYLKEQNTVENQEAVLKTWEQYKPIYRYAVNVMQEKENIDKITADVFYQKRFANVQNEWKVQKLTEGEMAYWTEKEQTLSVPFSYGYTEGWEDILTSFLTLNFEAVLLIAIALSNVFSEEHSKRMDQLILCSKYGKKKLFGVKIAAGMTFAALSSLLFLVVEIGVTLVLCGTEGADVPIQVALSTCSWNLTMGQAVVVLSGIYLAASLFLSVIAMFLSEVLKNSLAVMGILIGMLSLSMLGSIPYRFRILSQIWEMLPTALSRVWNFSDFRLVKIFGMYVTNFQIVPILYALISILLLFIGNRMYQNYQVSGR